MPQFVAYYRVSTVAQGRSGLGLDAQREAVRAFVARREGELVDEFTEVETGKGSNALSRRPQLRAALERARKSRATLVIAKLDRLARNVHFVTGLIGEAHRVPVVAVDMPEADLTMMQVHAVIAEHEARAISKRTREALAAAKARGTVLGANGRKLAEANKQAAVNALAPLRAQLARYADAGLPIRRIAEQLNSEGVGTPAGGRWHPTNVHRALRRLGLR